MVLAVCSALSLSPAFAGSSVFAVTKTDDTADGNCDADCSLREAIIAANASPIASTVNVPAGTYKITIGSGDDTGQQGDFDIAAQVTIQGSGSSQTIIDGNSQDTVFNVLTGGDATIRALTIQNGDNGRLLGVGGIYAQGSLRLESVHVVSNHGAFEGAGGIYAERELAIANSVISGNSAGSSSTGGVYAGWHTEITNSQISDNTATVGEGSVGGASIKDDATLTDVTITDNEAGGPDSVGALYTSFNDKTHLTRVKITGNTAIGNYAVGGFWNYADVVAHDLVIDANHGGAFGEGGLYVECCRGRLDLTDATISNNTGPDSAGGGVWNGGKSTFTNVTISGNSGGLQSSGGLYNSDGLTLNNVTITNNTGGADGAGGVWNDGNLAISNSIVAGNVPTQCKLSTGTFGSGGGNFDSSDSCTFDKATDHPATEPDLGPLADNGGFAMTHALLDGSPAIDAGVTCPPPAADERGVPRPQGAGCDSGAYEFGTLASVNRQWGDILCNGDANGDDAGALVRFVALGSETSPLSGGCPAPDQSVTITGWFPSHLWGDVNCDGAADVLDALYILRAAVGAALDAANCPTIGQVVQVS